MTHRAMRVLTDEQLHRWRADQAALVRGMQRSTRPGIARELRIHERTLAHIDSELESRNAIPRCGDCGVEVSEENGIVVETTLRDDAPIHYYCMGCRPNSKGYTIESITALRSEMYRP